jgi:hypothetical protein
MNGGHDDEKAFFFAGTFNAVFLHGSLHDHT